MKYQLHALKAELIKSKYANIIWITFIAFALAPLMGGVFMLVTRNPDTIALAGPLTRKSQAMNFSADWESCLGILTQAVGVGGVLVFGFVASWIIRQRIFRRYSKGFASATHLTRQHHSC